MRTICCRVSMALQEKSINVIKCWAVVRDVCIKFARNIKLRYFPIFQHFFLNPFPKSLYYSINSLSYARRYTNTRNGWQALHWGVQRHDKRVKTSDGIKVPKPKHAVPFQMSEASETPPSLREPQHFFSSIQVLGTRSNPSANTPWVIGRETVLGANLEFISLLLCGITMQYRQSQPPSEFCVVTCNIWTCTLVPAGSYSPGAKSSVP